jgi:hypothetical protein
MPIDAKALLLDAGKAALIKYGGHVLGCGGLYAGFMPEYCELSGDHRGSPKAATLMMCYDLIIFCLIYARLWEKSDVYTLYMNTKVIAATEKAPYPYYKGLSERVWSALRHENRERPVSGAITPGEIIIFWQSKDTKAKPCHVALALTSSSVLEVNGALGDTIHEEQLSAVLSRYGGAAMAIDPPGRPPLNLLA